MKRGLNDETDIELPPQLMGSLAKPEYDNDETRSESSSRPRLGQCEVCAAKEARYSCPKCEVKTCCVACVQIHKKELKCDGIRDRTKYIPLRKMTKMDFMNDYYFLEECTRYVEDRKTDRIKNFTRYNKILPSRLFNLRKAAAERNTTLRFLLNNFSRSKENTTIYKWNEKRIYWRVEFVFTNACNAKFVQERCSEDEPLHKLLDKYVGSESGIRELQFYQSVGTFSLKVLLKAEGIKRCRSRFYALDCSKTLRENLAGKTLVEFPCIYVSYDQQLFGFDVIDSDEDVVEETQKHESKFDHIHKEQLQKFRRKQSGEATSEDDDNGDKKKLQKMLSEKKREERIRKRKELENTPSNYLFSDEKLWDLLSSSEEENGNETEEEK